MEKLLAECGLTGVNAVATPGVRLSSSWVEKGDELEQFRVTAFRGAAARANYMAADRMDCQFAAKEICRWMSSPTQQSWLALKRLCRYLVGLPRLVYRYAWQAITAIDPTYPTARWDAPTPDTEDDVEFEDQSPVVTRIMHYEREMFN